MRTVRDFLLGVVTLMVPAACLADRGVAQGTVSSTPAGSHSSVGGAPALHQDPNVRQSSWPTLPLPKITLPKVTMPKVTMPKVMMPDVSLLTKPVKSGWSKVTAGTHKAWEGTKEVFTLGKHTQATHTAAGPDRPSFWRRIFVSEPEPPGPQTVGEWMAQPRLDP